MEDLLKWHIGLETDYEAKRPFPMLGVELTQKMKDNVSHFKTSVTLDVDSYGNIDLPEDYYYKTSIHYELIQNCGDSVSKELVPIEVVDDDKWAGRVSSSLKTPTLKYPVVNFNGKLSLKIEPKQIRKIKFVYLRKVDSGHWHYNLDADTDCEVFSEIGSRDVDLPALLLNDLARMILGYVGINLRDQELSQYAEIIKEKGV
jgi:hypothetical protein